MTAIEDILATFLLHNIEIIDNYKEYFDKVSDYLYNTYIKQWEVLDRKEEVLNFDTTFTDVDQRIYKIE